MPPPSTTYSRTYCTAEVVLSENEIEANGAAGVRLSEGGDPLLERNTVRGSGLDPNPNPDTYPDPYPNPNPNPNPNPIPLTLTPNPDP